jgi:hypothetical protein
LTGINDLIKVNKSPLANFRFATSKLGTGGIMSERKQEQKVKDVSIDDDYLCIELLNGLLLTGPLRTNPIHRESGQPESHAPAHHFLPAMSI